jgi:hypothetical protein
VKELLERLLWWMALPRLLDIAAEQGPDLDKLDMVRAEISDRMRVIADNGYRIEGLEESGPLGGSPSKEARLEKETQQP